MSNIRIEFDNLDELIEGVEQMMHDTLPEASERLAEVSVELARESFEKDEDPYGNTWAPWVSPPTRHHVKLMIETGDLMDSIQATNVGGHGFNLIASTPYAAYHQEGTRKMVARKFLPDSGLPTSWTPVFVDTLEEVLREMLFG